jgi:hypothetical protein
MSLTTATHRRLGPLVDDDDDYVLRLFTANLIRELCCNGSKPHEFWPQIPKQKKNQHEDFPLAQVPGSDWVGHIADYLSTKGLNRAFLGAS